MAGRSILFVCAGNACRSVMAEAFARRRFGNEVRVESAGLTPRDAAEAAAAIETLRFEFGIDASGHQPRGLDAVNLDDFTDIVALDKRIAAALRPRAARELVVWDVHDPAADDPAQYRRCALKILKLVSAL